MLDRTHYLLHGQSYSEKIRKAFPANITKDIYSLHCFAFCAQRVSDRSLISAFAYIFYTEDWKLTDTVCANSVATNYRQKIVNNSKQ